MSDMTDLADLINERLKRYAAFASVEELQNQADGRIAGAKTRVEAADNYFAEKKRQADTILSQAVEESEKLKANSVSRETNLVEREKTVEEKEHGLTQLAEELENRETEAQKMRVTAQRTMQDALAMQRNLDAKLHQLQSIASG